MTDLSPRQLKILKIITEEHIQTGKPVGSDTLDKKYNLGISPATIRNEMVQLEKKDLLYQPHTSAGRSPTPAALKLYIKQLMEEKQLTVTDEVTLKEKIWDQRHELNRLLSKAAQLLAKKTSTLAVAATEKGDVFHAGYANILDMPEFLDIEVTKTVLSIIEDFSIIQQIFKKAVDEGPLHVLVGEELGLEYLSPCGLVYTEFRSPVISGSIGVFGPSRLDYPWVIPTVRYFGDLINNALKNW